MEKRKNLFEKLEKYIEEYQRQNKIKSDESIEVCFEKCECNKGEIKKEASDQSGELQEKVAGFTENDAENLESLMQNLGETISGNAVSKNKGERIYGNGNLQKGKSGSKTVLKNP